MTMINSTQTRGLPPLLPLPPPHKSPPINRSLFVIIKKTIGNASKPILKIACEYIVFYYLI